MQRADRIFGVECHRCLQIFDETFTDTPVLFTKGYENMRLGPMSLRREIHSAKEVLEARVGAAGPYCCRSG